VLHRQLVEMGLREADIIRFTSVIKELNHGTKYRRIKRSSVPVKRLPILGSPGISKFSCYT
jgi:hypothetical protein